MYDPKDPFSLLNPYSAPNMLMKSSAAVYERHRQSVADSAKFVERMQSAGRSQAPAVYPRYTAHSAPVWPEWMAIETTTRRTGKGFGLWELLLAGSAFMAAGLLFL